MKAQHRDHCVASFSKLLDSGPAWLRGVGLDLLLEVRLAQRVAHWTAEALAAARRRAGTEPISTPPHGAPGGVELSPRQRATGQVPLVSERPAVPPSERQEPVARTDAVFDVARYDLETADGRRRAINDYLRVCTQVRGRQSRRPTSGAGSVTSMLGRSSIGCPLRKTARAAHVPASVKSFRRRQPRSSSSFE